MQLKIAHFHLYTPVYNWKSLNWFNASSDGNILEDTEIIYEAQLDDVL